MNLCPEDRCEEVTISPNGEEASFSRRFLGSKDAVWFHLLSGQASSSGPGPGRQRCVLETEGRAPERQAWVPFSVPTSASRRTWVSPVETGREEQL